jgi:homoserine dehydrogenase
MTTRLSCCALVLLLRTTDSAYFGSSGGPRAAHRQPAPAMMAKPVKVGMVGGGTVGGGIVEILTKKADFVKDSLGVDLQFKSVVVGSPDKPRDWSVPDGCTITSDVNAVLDDPEIDIVVEVMGGTTLAKDVVTRAIKAGKHVVTANKALIAADLPELQGLLNSVNAEREVGVQFGFEAAVCGGIPIIHALQRDFLGDDVTQLSGIINGCTNFMLSSMSQKGLSYAESLSEASALGYA